MPRGENQSRHRGLPPQTEILPSGSYRIRLSVRDRDGTRRRPSVTVRGTVDDVWRVYRSLDSERERGGVIDTSLTVAEWVERWLRMRRRTVGSPKTYDNDVSRTRPFVEMYGDLPLRAITTEDVDDFYATLTCEPQTVKGYHTVLRKMFNDARNRISHNPVVDAHRPRVIRKLKPIWDAETVATFLERSRDDRTWPYWWLALNTGMRREELVGLNWSDIDGDIITIRRRVVTATGGSHVLDATKTGKPERRIVIDQSTVDVLEAQRITQRRELLRLGRPWSPHTRLVLTIHGDEYNPDWISRRWRHAVLQSGVEPYMPLGQARHTWGTLALNAGIPPHEVTARLGNSTAVLLDRYAQPTTEGARRSAVVLESALKRRDSR